MQHLKRRAMLWKMEMVCKYCDLNNHYSYVVIFKIAQQEFSSARNQIWHLLWNQSIYVQFSSPNRPEWQVFFFMSSLKIAGLLSVKTCPELWSGRCNQVPAGKAPQPVVSSNFQMCLSIRLLDPSSNVESEGSGSHLECFVPSKDANAVSWPQCLHYGGWGKWDNAKDGYPPITFLETWN